MNKSISMSKPIFNKKFSDKFDANETYKIGFYEIMLDRQIGIGGYSVVYVGRCIDPNIILKYSINKTKRIDNVDIQNVVAIKKIIVKGLTYNHQRMITEEISIMQHIKENPHINIVKCYDIIDDLDTIYIVMEYCDGGDVSKIIGKPMKEESVKYYFSQLINGIKYLNEHKIIHRDIKPKNLLLTNNKQILKICDFGLAKDKTGLSKIYTICGSPLYMAPEMFNEKCYDDTVDIWSMGIIMYEMLYGNNPLSNIKDYNELRSFMTSTENIKIPPKYSKNINKNISDECIGLLKILLVKESRNRITLKELFTHEWLSNITFDHQLLQQNNEEDENDFTDFVNQSDNDDSSISRDNSNIFLFNLDE